MPNLRKWGSWLLYGSDPRRGGETPAAAAQETDLHYSWLLPGDLCIGPSPSTAALRRPPQG